MAIQTVWVLLVAAVATASALSNEALAQNYTGPTEEEAVEVGYNATGLAFLLIPAIAIVAGFVGFIIWKQKIWNRT